nr:Chain C, aa 4-17 (LPAVVGLSPGEQEY) of alternative reading frame of M-CSF [synthetic construct]
LPAVVGLSPGEQEY